MAEKKKSVLAEKILQAIENEDPTKIIIILTAIIEKMVESNPRLMGAAFGAVSLLFFHLLKRQDENYRLEVFAQGLDLNLKL